MFKLFKNPKLALALTLAIVIPFIYYNLTNHKNKVLGETVAQMQQTPASSPSLLTTPTPAPSSSASPASKLSKSTYTIAVYGDSLVDTMGERLEYLEKSLRAKYPGTDFKLYNYGIGGENVTKGLERFASAFSYQTRNYPPITQINADVIILGSFSYNPFPNHDAQKHYSLLNNLIFRAKATGAQVYLLAEIAPLENNFGDGPHGINWPPDLANLQAVHIVEQIQNVLSLATSTNTPIINAYRESLMGSKFGNPTYINSDDGIHPSVQGHVLTANLIARNLKLN